MVWWVLKDGKGSRVRKATRGRRAKLVRAASKATMVRKVW